MLKGAQMLLTCTYVHISAPLHRPLLMKRVASIIIIKRISRAPIYRTRRELRALYNNTNDRHNGTMSALTKHVGRKFGIQVFKTGTCLHCCYTLSRCFSLPPSLPLSLSLSLYIYIYTHTYTYIPCTFRKDYNCIM